MKTIQEVIIHTSGEKTASYVYSRIARHMYLQTFLRFGESHDYCQLCGDFIFPGSNYCPCGRRETVCSNTEMRRHIKEAISRGEKVEIQKQDALELFESVMKYREKDYAREKKYVCGFLDHNIINVTFHHYDRYAITGFLDSCGEGQIKIVAEADHWPPPDTYISLMNETYYCRVTGINNEWDYEVEKFSVGKYWPTGGRVQYPFSEILIDSEKAKELAKWAHNTMRHGFSIPCLRETPNGK